MHIDSAFPSKYLKASDLQGRNVTVKMCMPNFTRHTNTSQASLFVK